jgi:hypothetical protein
MNDLFIVEDFELTVGQNIKGTNVPTSNRNETITSEFVPEYAASKEIISILSMRADSGPNRNNLFSTRQIRERYSTKIFWFRFQNDIGAFVHSFLTLLVGTGLDPLTMNYLFILEDFELTVEAIVNTTDGRDRVGAIHNELSLYYRRF